MQPQNYMSFKFILHFNNHDHFLSSCNVLCLDGFLLCHRKYTSFWGWLRGTVLCCFSTPSHLGMVIHLVAENVRLSISYIFHNVCHMVSAQKMYVVFEHRTGISFRVPDSKCSLCCNYPALPCGVDIAIDSM